MHAQINFAYSNYSVIFGGSVSRHSNKFQNLRIVHEKGTVI